MMDKEHHSMRSQQVKEALPVCLDTALYPESRAEDCCRSPGRAGVHWSQTCAQAARVCPWKQGCGSWCCMRCQTVFLTAPVQLRAMSRKCCRYACTRHPSNGSRESRSSWCFRKFFVTEDLVRGPRHRAVTSIHDPGQKR